MIIILHNNNKAYKLTFPIYLLLILQLFLIQEDIKSKERKSQTPDFLPNSLLKEVDETDSYFHDVDGPQLSYLSNDCQNFGRNFDYYGDPIMP